MITMTEGYTDFEFSNLESRLVFYDMSINEYQNTLMGYMIDNKLKELDISSVPELSELKDDADYKKKLVIEECIKIAKKYPDFNLT